MTIQSIDVFPDVELALVQLLAPLFSDFRFSTRLPGGITVPTFRIKRISGAARDIRVDRPIVDVDVWWSDDGEASQAARQVQAALLGMRSVQFMNGVIQSVSVVNGPRWLPDPNTNLFRYNASNEVRLHA